MRSATRGSRQSGRFTPMFICGALVALLGVSVAPVQSKCSVEAKNGWFGGDPDLLQRKILIYYPFEWGFGIFQMDLYI